MAVERSTDERLTLGEILPARDDNPATQACRRSIHDSWVRGDLLVNRKLDPQ